MRSEGRCPLAKAKVYSYRPMQRATGPARPRFSGSSQAKTAFGTTSTKGHSSRPVAIFLSTALPLISPLPRSSIYTIDIVYLALSSGAPPPYHGGQQPRHRTDNQVHAGYTITRISYEKIPQYRLTCSNSRTDIARSPLQRSHCKACGTIFAEAWVQ